MQLKRFCYLLLIIDILCYLERLRFCENFPKSALKCFSNRSEQKLSRPQNFLTIYFQATVDQSYTYYIIVIVYDYRINNHTSYDTPTNKTTQHKTIILTHIP